MSLPDLNPPDLEGVQQVAEERLGHPLTDLQERAAASVLAGRDTLVVSPTGSGKSAIYQLTGALADELTVVVSPLLALQEDQLASIDELDIGQAVAVNSLHGERARRAALEEIAGGRVRFALLGPEQLANDDVLGVLQSASVCRLVVDEAHCLDAWGPDFRPDFLRVGAARRALGDPPVLALTATAAPHVRDAIISGLEMAEPEVFVADTERQNIALAIVRHPDPQTLRSAVVDEACERSGSGIVYVGTRGAAEDLATALRERRAGVHCYHGSLPASARAAVLRAFRTDEPTVVVATSAFGLGVDSPHVRFVLHAEAPETIDAYYQEIGRAGRDGEQAEAIMHTVLARASSRRFAAGRSFPSIELCAAVAATRSPVPMEDLRRALKASRGRFLQAVQALRRLDVVQVDLAGVLRWTGRPFETVEQRLIDELEERAVLVASRREMLDQYVESSSCRWATIVGYLGGGEVNRCGHCDACSMDGHRVNGPATKRLIHPTFGEGDIVNEEGDVMTVLFEHAGYRTLSRSALRDLAAQSEFGPSSNGSSPAVPTS
jgi:ATP-dependent DNA helicase RecQ